VPRGQTNPVVFETDSASDDRDGASILRAFLVFLKHQTAQLYFHDRGGRVVRFAREDFDALKGVGFSIGQQKLHDRSIFVV
jgi:hypothetical protein